MSGDVVRLPKSYRRGLRSEIFKTLKDEDLLLKGRISDLFFLERLYGKLNFWLFVEPKNTYAKESLRKLKNLEENLKKSFL